jgi:hypothetical protein
MKNIEFVILSLAFIAIKVICVLYCSLWWITFPFWVPVCYIRYFISFTEEERRWFGKPTIHHLFLDLVGATKYEFTKEIQVIKKHKEKLAIDHFPFVKW